MVNATKWYDALMTRPMTMFTGQWADLPLDEVASFISDCGYDGLELACWGGHFDVHAPESELKAKWEQLRVHNLDCFAISNHLVGQAVCDEIDEQVILPANSPYLKIAKEKDYIVATFNGERLPFLERDVTILPI